MRIKLNRTQCDDLMQFITFLLQAYPYDDRREKLLDIIVNRIRIKLRNKLDAIKPSTGYSITLEEFEALAFEEWFEQMAPALPQNNYIYEQTFTKAITSEINKTYG